MVKRITIYGWIVPLDPIRGPGSGTLVDLVYFLDDDIDIRTVIDIIRRARYKIIPKRIESRRTETVIPDRDGRKHTDLPPVEQDKVIIEDWDSHIQVGSERMPEKPAEEPQNDMYQYRMGWGSE